MRNILTYNVMTLIKMALAEDIGSGDITSIPMADALGNGSYAFIARESGSQWKGELEGKGIPE